MDGDGDGDAATTTDIPGVPYPAPSTVVARRPARS
jgi:hypothetical protein